MTASAEMTFAEAGAGMRHGHSVGSAAEGLLPDLSDVVDQAPCGVMLLDAGGDIVFANRRVSALFALSRAETARGQLRALIPDAASIEPVLERLADPRAARFPGMGEARMTLTGRRADGTEFPLDVHLSSIRHDARCWALAVLRDATEQCRMLEALHSARREAEAVARAKGEFLSFAAHDLTQPVQALELAIDAIARETPESDRLAELTAAAGLSVARMRELLKMLLEISRIESGAVRLDEQPLQIAEMSEFLERQFGQSARRKGLQLELTRSGEIIQTDPMLLRGMLGNLIGNAIRYTESGRVSLRAHAHADGDLDLEVSDTGLGIPSAELERIFDDFHRLDDARLMTQEGFGLGLGIVRRLSRLLGLSVSVQSTVGRGSTFSIRIPRSRVLSPIMTAQPQGAGSGIASASGPEGSR